MYIYVYIYIKQSLEAIAPALIQTGCQLNFRKSGVWSPNLCDVGGSGIQRLGEVPLFLKQALARHTGIDDAAVATFDLAGVSSANMALHPRIAVLH